LTDLSELGAAISAALSDRARQAQTARATDLVGYLERRLRSMEGRA
jgi:hypothetical protein